MGDDTIQVAVRVRPQIKRELSEGAKEYWKVNKNEIFLNDEVEARAQESYVFDYIFDTEKSNKDVYEIVRPIVQSAIQGINGTVFAYGQTSSGKTHSIMGSENDLGIIPRAVDDIFNHISESRERKFLVRSSFIEIYLEKIKDLLDIEKKEPVKIREDYYGTISLNCLEMITRNSKELLEVVSKGIKHRQVGETNMNERSSRSHVIFKIIIESSSINENNDVDDPVKVSHLYFIDLAGSERVAQTKATGTRLKEGGNINKSLSTLSLVIRQLGDAQGGQITHVNFRDSKLTRLLSNALGGNSKTLIIATITPVSIEDSQSTLLFAKCAKKVKSKPTVNEILTEAALIKRYKMKEKDLVLKLETEQLKNITLQADQENKEKKIRDLTMQLQSLRMDYVAEKSVTVVKRRHTLGIDKPTTYSDLSPQTRAVTLDISPLKIIPEEVSNEEVLLDRPTTPDFKIQPSTASTSSTPKEVLKMRLQSLNESHAELKEFCNTEAMLDNEELKNTIECLNGELSDVKDQLLVERVRSTEAYEKVAKMQMEIERLQSQEENNSKKMDDLLDQLQNEQQVAYNSVEKMLKFQSENEAITIKNSELQILYDLLKKKSKMREEELLALLENDQQKCHCKLDQSIQISAGEMTENDIPSQSFEISHYSPEILNSNYDAYKNEVETFKSTLEELKLEFGTENGNLCSGFDTSEVIDSVPPNIGTKLDDTLPLTAPNSINTRLRKSVSDTILYTNDIAPTNLHNLSNVHRNSSGELVVELKQGIFSLQTLLSINSEVPVETLPIPRDEVDPKLSGLFLKKQLDEEKEISSKLKEDNKQLLDQVKCLQERQELWLAKEKILEELQHKEEAYKKKLHVYEKELIKEKEILFEEFRQKEKEYRNKMDIYEQQLLNEKEKLLVDLRHQEDDYAEKISVYEKELFDVREDLVKREQLILDLQQINKERETSLDEYQNKTKDLEIELRDMKQSLSEKFIKTEAEFRKENQMLLAEINTLKKTQDKAIILNVELGSLKKKLDAKQVMEKELLEEKENLLKKLEEKEDYEMQMHVYIKDLTDIREELVNKEQMIVELQQMKNEYEIQIDGYKNKIKQLERDCEEMVQSLGETHAKTEALLKKENQMLMVKYKTQIDEYKYKMKQLERDTEEMIESLAEGQAKTEVILKKENQMLMNKYETQIDGYKNKIKQLGRDCEKMEKSLAEKHAKTEVILKKENQMLMDKYETQIDEYKNKIEQLERDCEKMEQSLAEKQAETEVILKKENEMLMDKYETQIDEYKNKIKQLEQHCEEMEQSLAEMHAKTEVILKKENQMLMDKYETQIDEYKNKLNQLERDCEEMVQSLAEKHARTEVMLKKENQMLMDKMKIIQKNQDKEMQNSHNVELNLLKQELEIKLVDINSLNNMLKERNSKIKYIQDKYDELLHSYEEATQTYSALQQRNTSNNNFVELQKQEIFNLTETISKKQLLLDNLNELLEFEKRKNAELKEEVRDSKAELLNVIDNYEEVKTELLCIKDKCNVLETELSDVKHRYDEVVTELSVQTEQVVSLTKQVNSSTFPVKEKVILTSQKYQYQHVSNVYRNLRIVQEGHIKALHSQVDYICLMRFIKNILSVIFAEAEGFNLAKDIVNYNLYKISSIENEVKVIQNLFKTNVMNVEATIMDIKQLYRKLPYDALEVKKIKEKLDTRCTSFGLFKQSVQSLHNSKVIDVSTNFDNYQQFSEIFDNGVDYIKVLTEKLEEFYNYTNNLFEQHVDFVTILVYAQGVSDLIGIENYSQPNVDTEYLYKIIYEPISNLKSNEKLQFDLAKMERVKKPFSKEDFLTMLSIKFERDRVKKEIHILKKELESLKKNTTKQEIVKPEDERNSKLKSFQGTVKARRDSLHDMKRGIDSSLISDDDCTDCVILQADKEALEAENLRLKHRIQDLDTLVIEIRKKLEDKSSKLKNSMAELEQIRCQDTVKESNLKTVRELQMQIKKLEEMIADLTSERDNTKKEAVDLRKQINTLKYNLDVQQKEIITTKDNLSKLKVSNGELAEALNALPEKSCISCKQLEEKLNKSKQEILGLTKQITELSKTDSSIMCEMIAHNFQNERNNAVTYIDTLVLLTDKTRTHGHDGCIICIKIHSVIKNYASRIQSLKNSHNHLNTKLNLDICDLKDTESHCSDLLKISSLMSEQIGENTLQILGELNKKVRKKIQKTEQLKYFVSSRQKYLVDAAQVFKEEEDEVRKIRQSVLALGDSNVCPWKSLNSAMSNLVLEVCEYLSLVIDMYKPNVESMEPLGVESRLFLRMHETNINELEGKILKIVDRTQCDVFIKYKEILLKYNFAKALCDTRMDKIKVLEFKLKKLYSPSALESASTTSTEVDPSEQEIDSGDSSTDTVKTNSTPLSRVETGSSSLGSASHINKK